MMEDKQLDFNAPFLSVRRMSAEGKNSKNIKKNEDSIGGKTHVPPFYKADLKSGPMRNAGAVPFVWEQIPGKRKDGEGYQEKIVVHRPPASPSLPPGRKLEAKKQLLDKGFSVRSLNKPQIDNGQTNRQEILLAAGNVSKLGIVSKLENSKGSKQVERDSDSEDSDEAYADALETLSRTESFFYNCSVSGISGLDEANVNRLGISSTDPQTREFMMDRFLPAAKAMASEAPQHASRRQPVPRERSIIMKTAEGDRQPPLYQYKPYIMPQYVQETVEEESEDEDYDFGETENFLAKGCGWIPKFCSKSSFCLLNPVPGVKVRSRAPLPPGRKFSPHVKATKSGSYTETDDVNNWEAVYKHKLLNGLHPLDDESKLTSDSNQLTYWSDSQTPDGSSPRTHSPGGVISPFRSEANQSPFNEGGGFLGIPKQVTSSKVNHSISYKDAKWGSGSVSPMVEKTLYVDSGYVPTPVSNMNSSDTREMIDCREDSSEVLTECRALDMPIVLSVSEDIKDLTISQEKDILKQEMSVVISNFQSSSDRSNPGTHTDHLEGFRRGDLFDRESRSLMHSEAGTSGNFMFEETESLKDEDGKNFNGFTLQFPLAPPLPKSPSESWLWRTLPSISSKNGASFYPRKYSKTPSVDPKWETIVKTSNVHHSYLRFSEELKTPLPQQSET